MDIVYPKTKLVLAVGLVISGTALLGWTWYGQVASSESVSEAPALAPPIPEEEPVPLPPEVLRVPLPSEVRGLYFTGVTAGSALRRGELLDYMAETGLNAVVVDLKMDNGELAFTPFDQTLRPYAQDQPGIDSLDALLDQLHDRGIYRIARIPVMRDGAFVLNHPELGLKTKSGKLWLDNTKSLWVDPTSSEVRDYALALAREAHARGFDEVQLDYVRFVSDGSLHTIAYPLYDESKTKIEVMQEFFKSVGGALRAEGIPVSFDLFGITLWSNDDYNIGQRLIDAYPHADFISPMVYPSHYPANFEGYRNPADYPYEVISKTLEKGIEILKTELAANPEEARLKIRPWLQDFDIGAVYDAQKIEAQIKAVRDSGASGWILWNARNIYEPAEYVGAEER